MKHGRYEDFGHELVAIGMCIIVSGMIQNTLKSTHMNYIMTPLANPVLMHLV